MCRTKTIDDIRKFKITSIILAEEFSLNESFYLNKSHLPVHVNAFSALVCLCLHVGLCGAEISRMSNRNCRGVYKSRNRGYDLLSKDNEFKTLYTKAKNRLNNAFL